LTIEQIVARHKQRSGFRLADYAEVAIPIYKLHVQALTLAHRRLPPVEEFILKCLAVNVFSVEEIRDFLGLEEEVVKSALVNLAQTESIALTAPRGRQTWMLTSKGRATLQTAELVSPEEQTFSIQFDIITRKPALYRFQKPLKHKELIDEGLKEIEITPRKHPQPGEITPMGIEKILKATPGLTDQRRDVLAIRSLENIKPFYIRALALVYRSTEGEDVQIAFIIDGKLSEEHQLAFAGTDACSRLIAFLSVDPDERKELDDAAAAARDWAPSPDTAQQLRLSTDSAEAQVAEAAQLLEAAESSKERLQLWERLQAAEKEVQRLQEEAKRLQVRNLYVADHPPLLEDALRTAQSRLMIISPWIKRKVVDQAFVRKLEQLLANGVKIYIGYGINEQPTANASFQDAAAVNDLKNLSNKYPTFTFKRLGNTHAKVLIKDSEFAAVTSFNWLSFKGDPHRTFRDEQGTLLQVSELVEGKFRDLEPRFACPNAAGAPDE
jgi:hypothetical protein